MRWRRGNCWRPLDARSGSSRDLPIAGDRPWIVERSRGQLPCYPPLMLPSVLARAGSYRASPEPRVRACVTRLSVPPTRRLRLPECRLNHEALPEDAYAFGRGQRLLSCRRAALLPGLPLQCAYRTPRPGISTRGPARGLAPNTPKAGSHALRRHRKLSRRRAPQTAREPHEKLGSLGDWSIRRYRRPRQYPGRRLW